MRSSVDSIFHPIVNGLQKMALYKTRTRFYLIGCNITQTKFRVLKIDRTEPTELVLTDDRVEYNHDQIKDLLVMIGEGNKVKQTGKTGGVIRTVSSFGILGFIRFLKGYYIILITKRLKVSAIGQHSIYQVEDTKMIYIPHESVSNPDDDEAKYVRLFNNMELKSNFYFSYSYDLSNSLQYNMTPPSSYPFKREQFKDTFMNQSMTTESKFSKSEDSVDNINIEREKIHIGVRNNPCWKFVWNSHLLDPVKDRVHLSWIIPVIHGFITQSNISVYGQPFFLTLIARRSACYAGTRFLKRGANFEGDVANEVETEQILHDAHISSLQHGRFTSFVQLRGSIPCHWSQDISKVVRKPPISLDLCEPYAETAGKHFNKLLSRFGSPIIALNLVKRRERKAHESILNEEYNRLISQLNITLPPAHKIQLISVDMARINKEKGENVMSRLADIAYVAVKRTGFFRSHPPYFSHQHLNRNQDFKQMERARMDVDKNCDLESHAEVLRQCQTGIIRVNCVDCLDRTNTAQFALGKCALAFQLYSFGLLEKPTIEFDSDCVRILEEMFEDHGDTLALQYGGSQLVHRIQTYRNTAGWANQGNDFMQSLSRYYSNTFSDQEKQHAMNLFLGAYIPKKVPWPIWDLESDYILHQSLYRESWPCHRKSTSQWWSSDVMNCLPLACDEVNKVAAMTVHVYEKESMVDLYRDFHLPFELRALSEIFLFNVNHSVRNCMPNFTTDESPFVVRRRQGKKHESASGAKNKNTGSCGSSVPLGCGDSYTSSTASSSDTSDEISSEIVSLGGFESESPYPRWSKNITYGIVLPPPSINYRELLQHPCQNDMITYKRFVQRQCRPLVRWSFMLGETPVSTGSLELTPIAVLQGTSFDVHISDISANTSDCYQRFVSTAANGPSAPRHEDLLIYQKFASVC